LNKSIAIAYPLRIEDQAWGGACFGPDLQVESPETDGPV